MKQNPENLICLGKIIEAYGVKGWVKVRPYSEPDVLLTAKEWRLKRDVPALARATPSYDIKKILKVKEHSGAVVALLEGCTDRTTAETFKGNEIFVERSQFPSPEEGTYYWVDLIDCQVVDTQNTPLGVVVDVTDNGAQALLVVHAYVHPLATPPVLALEKNKPVTFLIPFVEQFVLDVSLEKKCVQVDWSLDW